MNIMGHGVDIVDLNKFKSLLEGDDSDLETRCFTSLERENAAQRADPSVHLAGCFAAKEAVVKAMGCGFDGEVSPLEIEITSVPSGAPEIVLTGAAAKRASSLGISRWLISRSDAAGVAVASVLGLG